MAQTEWQEQWKVEGAHLVDEVKRIVHEGNVRHLIIKHDGATVLEVPLTAGVAVALLAPTVAALAAVGAALTHCTLEVLRVKEE